MRSSCTTGAVIPEICKREEPQEVDIDLYLKFYFTTLNDKFVEVDDSSDHKVSEGLIFRNIIGDGREFENIEDKISHTFFVDCSDCVVNEDLCMIEAEGAIIKVINAVDCLIEYAKQYIYTTRKGKIHVAIFGVDLVEDIAHSFAYIVDKRCGLQIPNERLCSYVLQFDKVFDDLKNRNWCLYTDYLAILDYYILVEPNNYESNDCESSIENMHTCTEDSNDNESDIEQSDTLLLKGEVSYDNHVLSPIEKDFVDDLQDVLNVISFLPCGEVASLINGFIYLGKEIKACEDWDLAEIEYNKSKAIASFVGAIPGASMVKAVMKIRKAANAYKQIKKAGVILENIARKERRSRQTLDRIRTKKMSSKRRSTIKRNHALNRHISKKAKINIKEIVKIHSKQIEDSGLTIENLTIEGQGFWVKAKKHYNNYRMVVDKVMKNKLPQTHDDRVIDNIFRPLNVVCDLPLNEKQ